MSSVSTVENKGAGRRVKKSGLDKTVWNTKDRHIKIHDLTLGELCVLGKARRPRARASESNLSCIDEALTSQGAARKIGAGHVHLETACI